MDHEQTLQSNHGRGDFIRKVYGHLFGAIVAFIAIEYYLFTSGLAAVIAQKFLSMSWLIILGAFVLLGWLARHMASANKSLPVQYISLCFYILLQAVIFIPILFIAALNSDATIIQSAGGITIAAFAILTTIVFVTKADFSFLRSILMWAGILAFVGIVASFIFPVTLGLWFSIGMVALAGAAILYDTSNIRLHYGEDQYVGAALDLFASVAMMFWYVIRIFMSRD